VYVCVQSTDLSPVVCVCFLIIIYIVVLLANPFNWIKMASNAHC